MKSIEFEQKLVFFVQNWYIDGGNKNKYRGDENFEVKQAHAHVIFLEKPPPLRSNDAK